MSIGSLSGSMDPVFSEGENRHLDIVPLAPPLPPRHNSLIGYAHSLASHSISNNPRYAEGRALSHHNVSGLNSDNQVIVVPNQGNPLNIANSAISLGQSRQLEEEKKPHTGSQGLNSTSSGLSNNGVLICCSTNGKNQSEERYLRNLIKKYKHGVRYCEQKSDTGMTLAKNVKKLSEMMIKITKGYEKYPSLSVQKDIDAMQVKLDNLIEKVEQQLSALQSSQLTQDDLNRLADLTTVPTKPICKTSYGKEFYNPRVSLMGLYDYFLDFMKEWDYAGASILMPTDTIYTSQKENKIFSRVLFKNKSNLLPKYSNIITRNITKYVLDSNLFTNHLTSAGQTITKFVLRSEFPDAERHLRHLIPSMLEKWGFDTFEVGNVNRDFFLNNSEESEYDSYLLLYYKEKPSELMSHYQEKIHNESKNSDISNLQ